MPSDSTIAEQASALLPPNATAGERALSLATARAADVEVPHRSIWDPFTCPAGVLPWLAWALSVDDWDAGWDDTRKRAAVAASIDLHRKKGTVGAVRKALQAIGYEVQINELTGVPYVFRLEIDAGIYGIKDTKPYDEAERIALSQKNARSHLAGVDAVLKSRGNARMACVAFDGVATTIEPAYERYRTHQQQWFFAVTEYTADTVTFTTTEGIVVPVPLPAPTGLAATVATGAVSLTWDASPDTRVTSYRIYRDGVPFASGVSATAYAFSAESGVAHSYTVTAVSSSLESAQSVAVNATALASITAPTGLVAIGSTGAVSLSWTASTDARVTGYRIYRDGVAIAGVSATAYTDNVAGVAYSYAVTAVAATEESAQSGAVSVMVAISLIDLGSDSIETFEGYAVGSLSTMPGGLGWGATGALIDYSFNFGTETFDDYQLGAVTTLAGGAHFSGPAALTIYTA